VAVASLQQALIERVAGRSRRHAGALWPLQRAGVPVRLRQSADEVTAEDIVSEVLSTFGGASSFRLFQAFDLPCPSRHQARLEDEAPLTEPLDEAAAETIADTADGPETILQGTTASIVAEALKQLSPAHREIVDLVYFTRSRSLKSRTFSIPEATVKRACSMRAIAGVHWPYGHSNALLYA
jgi:RNA polymerase sigma-70 factor (ECF subfamily)